MNRALICDISRHQGKVNFRKMREAGAAGVICRATVGDYYQDAQLERNYQESRAAGLLFGAYLVVAPADTAAAGKAGRKIDAGAHLEKFFRAMEGKESQLPYTVDAELERGCDAAWITAVIQGVVRGLDQVFPGRVQVYTRQSWWDRFVLRWSGWGDYGLHAARYQAGLTGPWSDGRFKFRDWQRWKVWQYSADGNRQGPKYGAESDDIDLNWWSGTVEDLLASVHEGKPVGRTIEERVRAIEDYLVGATSFRL